MSYYVMPLIALGVCLTLAVLVFFRNPRVSYYRLLSLFLFCLAVWAGLIFGMRTSPRPETALFWHRALMPWLILGAVVFFHFSCLRTRRNVSGWWIVASYLFLLFVVIIPAPTGLITKGMTRDPYGYLPIAGPLLYLVSLAGYIFFIAGLVNFIKGYRASADYEEKNSYLYVIIGVMLFLLAGVADIISILGVPLPALGMVGVSLFGLLASVSIFRYHLLYVRLVLRKGTAYLLTSSIVALPYVGIIFLIHQILTDRALSIWGFSLALLLLTVSLQPLWRWAQRAVDRLFYRERYDYLQALEHFSHEAQAIGNLEQLGSTLVRLVSESLQSSQAYLLLPSLSGDDFVTTAVYQFKSVVQPPTISIPERSSLIQWLERHDGFVSAQDLDVYAQLQTFPASERQTLQTIGAQLYIPIKTRDKELVGVLILGAKRSQQLYSIEDKQILAPIANQMAMSLDNARLLQQTRDSYEQLKSTQEYLIRSEKLRAVGQISSGIAHDFNNMLTGILGRAQLALDQVQDARVERHLKLIEQAALDAAQIVHRLQDFTRVRTDRASSLVHLNKVVEDTLEMVKPRLSEQSETRDTMIEISLHLGNIRPVRGNGAELREALMNILINAVEAMPYGGNLSLSTRQHDNLAIVTISDTGVGMTGEVMKRIFEPFFTTKGQHGIGMGLSLVYGIIKRHGGDITVSSEPQKGATFNVILPVALEDTEEVALPVLPSNTGHAAILVIDDSEAARSVLFEMLTRAGHTVSIAASGEEGLSLAQQSNYALVVTDLGLPGISGRDVARAIKRDSPQTRVIMITGWGVQIDPAHEIVDGIIAKPFQKEDILRQIAQLLNTQESKVQEPERSSRIE